VGRVASVQPGSKMGFFGPFCFGVIFGIVVMGIGWFCYIWETINKTLAYRDMIRKLGGDPNTIEDLRE
jgi:hypothetical protein